MLKLPQIMKNTTFGKDCRIWSFVNIYNSEIGDNCMIGSYVEIGGAKIGKNCAIQSRAFIPPGTILGNDIFIGPGVIITNDKHPRAHNTHYKLEPVIIKEGASIGAGSIILPGVTVGRYAMIGAGSLVTRDIPDYALAYGHPADIKGKVNKFGEVLE